MVHHAPIWENQSCGRLNRPITIETFDGKAHQVIFYVTALN